MTEPSPKISVVIPHRNDEQGLELCLTALANQSFSSAFEVIVVDNGSATPPEDVCAKWPSVTLLHEPNPGPGPARNLGVATAKSQIIAFTDSDCVPHQDWLSAIERGFLTSSAAIVSGRIVVPLPQRDPPNMAEYYETAFGFPNRKFVEKKGFGAAANLAVRRHVFDKVGGFAGIDFAEDEEWGMRATRAGFPPVYLDDMQIDHPPRRTLAALNEKLNRQISHDFNALKPGIAGKAFWLGRAAYILGYSIWESAQVFVSPRLQTWPQRRSALAAVFLIRTHRAFRMVSLLFTAAKNPSIRWNQD